MFEAFVIALREGAEASLVVGLLLAYLEKSGRAALRRSVFAGLAAAAAASVGLAALLSRLGLDPENETVEGTLLLVSALLVGSLVVWMARHGRRLRGTIERKVEALAPDRTGRAPRLGVFLLSFLLVGREGVELVLFLGAATLRAEGAPPLLGGLAGLALSVGLGIAFFRGSLRVDLRRFFRVTTAMLLVFAVELLALALHEFVEAGAIRPANPERYMSLVGPLVRNRVLFAAAMILLPLSLLLAGARPLADAAAPLPNPAEARKLRAQVRSGRFWRRGFAALASLALLALGVHAAVASRGLELSPATPLAPLDGAVRVPLGGLEERRLHRFGIELDGRIVRLLVWKNGADVRVALDACRLCRDQGYVQQGEHLICRNCLAEIHPPSLGAEGGCNPIPLPFRLGDEQLLVRLEDLESGKGWFAPSPGPELVCPTCAMRFRPEDSGGSIERGGRRIPVCGMETCRARATEGK
ncbi:MAG TPA: Fe-S-containing protein [Planctomycetota bacterium]|nr:Fe-S-containing protein [Planctomycetota bacterium]